MAVLGEIPPPFAPQMMRCKYDTDVSHAAETAYLAAIEQGQAN